MRYSVFLLDIIIFRLRVCSSLRHVFFGHFRKVPTFWELGLYRLEIKYRLVIDEFK